MQWQFNHPIAALISDEIEMQYTCEKLSLNNAFKGRYVAKGYRNIFTPTTPLPVTENSLFSYVHVIYFLAKPELKVGWNIIIYSKKRALIIKDDALFLEVKNFDTIESLYQYLYRFEFDDAKPFQLIENTDNPIINIEKALASYRFRAQFNLNKKWPLWDLAITAGLLFLFLQTVPTTILRSPYPKDKFFQTIGFLESRLNGCGHVHRIENKNGTLKLSFSKKIPLDIVKGLPDDVTATYR